MKKTTTVEITYSTSMGDLCFSDDRTFGHINARHCQTVVERQSFLALKNLCYGRTEPLRLVVKEEDFSSPRPLFCVVVNLLGVLDRSDQHYAVQDIRNPKAYMGRPKATSIRKLMGDSNLLELVAMVTRANVSHN